MIDEWGKGAKYWDHAWNPVIGCKPVSEGCLNCYAARLAAKFPELQDDQGGFEPHAPKSLKSPPKQGVVFVGNMTDLFGEWNDKSQIYRWFDLLCMNPGAVNLILTKRPERFFQTASELRAWWGITAENQDRLDERLPHLYFTSGHRWLSLEPLLGPIDIEATIDDLDEFGGRHGWGIDWVVVGAESGPDGVRRPCKLEWVEQIVEQCRAANVPVFVKQLELNGKLVKDIAKFPAHLQIRQVPWGKGEKNV